MGPPLHPATTFGRVVLEPEAGTDRGHAGRSSEPCTQRTKPTVAPAASRQSYRHAEARGHLWLAIARAPQAESARVPIKHSRVAARGAHTALIFADPTARNRSEHADRRSRFRRHRPLAAALPQEPLKVEGDRVARGQRPLLLVQFAVGRQLEPLDERPDVRIVLDGVIDLALVVRRGALEPRGRDRDADQSLELADQRQRDLGFGVVAR